MKNDQKPDTAAQTTQKTSVIVTPLLNKEVDALAKTQAITLAPTPLKIDVNTATDWPAVSATSLVGFASIATAIVVSKISRANQISQNKATTANLRKKWQDELRAAVSEYVGLLLESVFLIRFQPKVKQDPHEFAAQRIHDLGQLMTIRSKIFLMLDKKQTYTVEAIELLDQCAKFLEENKEASEMQRISDELLEKFRDILEKAWIDMKNDLNS